MREIVLRGAILGGGEMLGACRIERQIARIDDDIDAVEFAEFAQFRRGASGLDRTAARKNVQLRQVGAAQRLEGVQRRGRWWRDGRAPRARIRTASIVTLPMPITAAALLREVESVVRVFGMAVVPRHQFGRRMAAGQVFAGNAEMAVGFGTDGVEHRVVVLAQFGGRDVAADLDVAQKTESGLRCDALEHPGD